MVDKRIPGAGLLQGRPLLDTRTDMRLYVSRPELEEPLDAALRAGFNVLLVGDRGSGKTTQLRALMHQNRGKTEPSRSLVYVSATAATTAAEALYLVRQALWQDTDDATAAPGPVESVGALQESETQLRGLRRDLERFRSERGTPDVVVLVDGVNAAVGHHLFGVLRDEIWELGALWVVTATSDQVAKLITPPADAFFDVILTMPALTTAEAAELVKRRLGRKLELPAGIPTNPRELLALIRHASPQDVLAAKAARDVRIHALGRSASMLASLLEQLGPVSASDKRLLAETGWTRARAGQVFKQLLDNGLVDVTEQATGRPGRPERIYRLLDPWDAEPPTTGSQS